MSEDIRIPEIQEPAGQAQSIQLEVTALHRVGEALAALDIDARSRVLRWAAERFNVDLSVPLKATGR